METVKDLKKEIRRLEDAYRDYRFDANKAAEQRKLMFRFPRQNVVDGGAYRLNDLAERTAAAHQLGYHVVLEWCDNGLNVYYEKIVPVPYSL